MIDISLKQLYKVANDVIPNLDVKTKQALAEVKTQEDLNDVLTTEQINKIANAVSYKRPNRGWLANPISKMLGPLPSELHIDLSNRDPRVLTYRWQAIGTLFMAITMLFGAVYYFPWMAYSPLSVTTIALDATGIQSWMQFLITAVVIFVFIRSSIKHHKATSYAIAREGFWNSAAAEEELWFRAGSEHWNNRQRLTSCMGFGLIHISNFFYPIASVLVLMIIGGVLMAVYLRAYRRTGSTTVATVESSLFHATYNRFAILYMLAAVAILLAV